MPVGDGVVAAEFDESFVKGMGDEIVIVVGGLKRPVEVALNLNGEAHAAEFEVAHPQLGVGQASVQAGLVQDVGWVSHRRGPKLP